ncbi:MAG TPA: hypothetical protein VG651_22060 [Stellaceae bacterium]|nr:hypothetical protein [Stellaceae bacterium]
MAVTLTSKESHQISFPGGTLHPHPPVLPPANLTVTVETGVVVFTLLGTNPHDWTRDTLSFPVGPAAPEAEFVNGVAAAAPTSFWTPMNNVATAGGGNETVFVSGFDSNNDQFSGSGVVQLPPVLVPPPVGFAIDSAEISHGQTGRPALTLALAVFGNCAAMLRASYTAYIITRPGIGVVVGNSGEASARA